MVQGLRTFAIKRNGAGSATVPVTINDTSGKPADVGLWTWGASSILANELHHLAATDLAPDPPAIHESDTAKAPSLTPILELGAGTGLVGLAAALLWPSPPLALLTDLPSIVPNLASNVRLNAAALAERGARVAVGALDWAVPLDLVLSDDGVVDGDSAVAQAVVRPGGARVVFAADVLYSEELPPLLVDAVCAWLERSAAARVVLAYPLRVFMLDIIRDLWARLEEAGMECVREGRAELRDDEGFDDEAVQEWCVWRWKEGAW